jgi:RNA polymerase sigma-70 factor (ECF subfamily)
LDNDRKAFETRLLEIIPDLRAFARFLAGDPTEADDLVQDTMVRALRAYQQFDLDTDIKAWTFTILRNQRINAFHKKRVTVEFQEDHMLAGSSRAGQEVGQELREVLAAMRKLPSAQREVITLIRAQGMTYEEAAEITGCKIGTIKSRLNRADSALRMILGPEYSDTRTRRPATRRMTVPTAWVPPAACGAGSMTAPLHVTADLDARERCLR